jgi:hypothetical protein
MIRLLFSAAVVSLALVGVAKADPCEAIPESGYLPGYLSFGSTFSGPVVHVIDGDSLCVAVGPTEREWVEVRLADFYAPESSERAGHTAKAALERIALGREAVCVANMRTYDRIAARCRIDGQPIGDLMRSAGISEGGRGTGGEVVIGRAEPRGGLVAGSNPFRSCAAARAAGAAPVYQGSPGYNPNLDGDADGIACEPYKPR